MRKIIVRSRASLRPKSFKEFLKDMKIKLVDDQTVKLYLEYIIQHEGLKKFL